MRRISKALMVSTAALLVLVSTAGLAGHDDVAPAASVRPLHDGDAGAYRVAYEGDWRHDGGAAGMRAGPSFEVLDARDLRDEDGRTIEALPILWRSEAASFRPTSAGPVWVDIEQQYWFLDGVVLATQQVHDRALGASARHDEVLVYGGGGDCILSGPGTGRATPADCRLDGVDVMLPAGTALQVHDETVDGLRLRHVVADGAVRMEWWYSADLPVPVRFHFDTVGPHGLPRSATYDLQGFRAGDGQDMPQGTAIIAQPVRRAPMEMWGLSDAGIDHPFRLSTAFDAALTSGTFSDLRDWLRFNPHGYVFRAEYAEDRSGRETLRAWDLHLSDGHDGFSLRISQSDDIQLLTFGGVRIERLDPSPLARQAPVLAAVGDVPTIASVWERWGRHVTATERNLGANAWGFEILRDDDGEPAIRIAGGRTSTLHWGPEGLALLGLAATGEDVSVLTMDGHGQTARFERHTSGPAQHMVPSPPMAPAAVAGYATSGWSVPTGTEAASIGLMASALGALYLAWPLLKASGLALFSRLRPHELLEDPTRATIMDALQGEPGLHFRALCDRLGANPGRIRHHVHKLEQGGLIRARQSPGYTCYYLAATSRTILDAGPVLRSDGARHILAAVHQAPGSSSKELAGAAGLAPATATYHLKRLQDAGLLDARRDGRSVRVHLTAGGLQAANAFGVA